MQFILFTISNGFGGAQKIDAKVLHIATVNIN